MNMYNRMDKIGSEDPVRMEYLFWIRHGGLEHIFCITEKYLIIVHQSIENFQVRIEWGNIISFVWYDTRQNHILHNNNNKLVVFKNSNGKWNL